MLLMPLIEGGSHRLKIQAAEWQKEEKTKLACREVPRHLLRTFPFSPHFPEPSYTGTPSGKRAWVAMWGFWKRETRFGGTTVFL